MPDNAPARIVVIDDDREHLQFLLDVLSAAGYDAAGYEQAPQALTAIAQSGASLVITDIFMPGMDGFEVLRHLQQSSPSTPVIAIDHTLPDDQAFLRIIKRMGAVDAVARPVDAADILAAVERVLRPQ